MSEHESTNPPGWTDDEPADDREVEVELDGVADEPEPWVAGLEADADDQAPPAPPAPPAPSPASPQPAAGRPAPSPDDELETDLEDLARLAAEDDAHGDHPETEGSDLGFDLDALEAAVHEMGLDPEDDEAGHGEPGTDEPGAHEAASTPEPPPARPQPPAAPSDQPTSVPPPSAAPTDELASMPPPPAPPAHPDPDTLADWTEPQTDEATDEPADDAAAHDDESGDQANDGAPAAPVDLQNFTAKGGSGTAGGKRSGKRGRFGR